jgi:hypothetical protein
MYGGVSGALADAVRADPLTRQYYGRPPLRDTILLPDQAQLPGRKYLDWHRANIFAARSGAGTGAIPGRRLEYQCAVHGGCQRDPPVDPGHPQQFPAAVTMPDRCGLPGGGLFCSWPGGRQLARARWLRRWRPG